MVEHDNNAERMARVQRVLEEIAERTKRLEHLSEESRKRAVEAVVVTAHESPVPKR